jgi:hypothetical protein
MAAVEPHTRTVYVSVTDQAGAPVTDLNAADFTVKEGGKDRAIDTVTPATDPIELIVLVQARLAAIDGVHGGIGQLVEPLLPKASISIATVAFKNDSIIDRSANPQALVTAINAMGRNPTATDEHVVEGVFEAAKQIEQMKVKRSAIVLIAISGPQVTNMSADQALGELAKSGATMYAATLDIGRTGSSTAGGIGQEEELDHVLGDGPRQSGGRRDELAGRMANGLAKILAAFGAELQHQYAITYTLPDGVKPDSRVTITLSRKNATLHAPSRVPTT